MNDTVEYRLRMTRKQWDAIKIQADEKNLTVPEYIRLVLVKELAKTILHGEESENAERKT